jgi:hypothetical protein
MVYLDWQERVMIESLVNKMLPWMTDEDDHHLPKNIYIQINNNFQENLLSYHVLSYPLQWSIWTVTYTTS